METGLPQQAELEFVSPQGKKTGVMVLTSPIRDREGRVTHVAVMATDLTRILQVQDRLSHLGLVIGSLSHGIKGLLTGMDAGLYYLETGLAKGDTHLVDQGLSVVRLSLGRIRSMVLDILMFSKDRPMAAETVRLQTFAQHLADEIRLRLAPHGLEFRVDIEAGDQDIQIDAGLIRAALMNLFDNAVDACLSDKFKPNHFIRFTVRPRENGASFEIEDNGVGMDEETRSKVFAMFFSSKGSKGTGLGLFVTRQIVDQHHGRIEMDATLGKGARFRVLL
jgi:signal transduction histidine kinase